MNFHELKCEGWLNYQAVSGGRKRAEFRKNDRDFAVGDLIRLREFVAEADREGYFEYVDENDYHQNRVRETGYTGGECLLRVTHVQEGGVFGIPEGYVILSLERVEVIPA